VFDGNVDNPAGGTAREFPSDLTFWPERLPTPSVTSYNLGVRHELPRSVIIPLMARDSWYCLVFGVTAGDAAAAEHDRHIYEYRLRRPGPVFGQRSCTPPAIC
jgi:hypothetical protein